VRKTAFSYQLSAISYQLSAFSYQLSAFSYQLSAFSFQLMDAAGGLNRKSKGNARDEGKSQKAISAFSEIV
jgi:hypothetical protein